MPFRLPTWEELASQEEQLEVLEHPLDQPLFVVGPPGSGKTVLAVQRAQMVAEEAPLRVTVVTYNRMLRRLLTLMDEDDSVDARTMQSFVWFDYRNRTNDEPPRSPHNRFEYVWPAMLERLRLDGSRSDRTPLIVDEGQDLPEGFFQYAAQHISQVMSVFADDDQALSDRHTTLEQIKAATGLDDPIVLSRNHRNTPEVARLAEHFHSGRLPAAEVRRPSSSEIPRLVRSKDGDSTAGLVSNWYKTRGGSIGVIVHCNDTGRDLHGRLVDLLPEQRVHFYENRRGNENSINVLTPGITVVNQASVKGQEFDAVFILELEHFIPCANDGERRAMYMMCSRARDHLFLAYGPGELSAQAVEALPGPDVLERS